MTLFVFLFIFIDDKENLVTQILILTENDDIF
jgi:hypothetical protein